MASRAAFLLLIGVLSCNAPSVSAPSRSTSSAVDATRDARLAMRVRLRAEAIPLRRIFRALAEETGVRLAVSGSASDERLVAFVPDASLEEVMLAVADLYRLSWSRGGSAERPSYQLLKAPALAREERALRERSSQQLRERLAEKLRAPQRPAGERPDPWATVYPLVLPLITAHSADLLQDGFAYIPIAALPAEQRGRLVRAMQPLIDTQHVAMQEFVRASRERRRAEGGPDLEYSVEKRPAPAAESCTITMEVAVRDELTASVGLKTGAGSWSGWFSTSSDGLHGPGVELYRNRGPKLPATADEEPELRPEGRADPLARPVEVAAEKPLHPGDWIGALGRLSDAAGVALYADCYPNYLNGITWHPRSDFTVSGKISVARALNRLCYPLANRGAEKLSVNSFWWRRGDAALIRSGRWLWESAAVLPTDLLDRLITSLRTTRQLDPRDLPAIASLTGLQVQSIGFLDGSRDTWRLAVQLPAGLSLEARKLLLTSGLSWGKMAPGDRALLTRLLLLTSGDALSRYAARLKTAVHSSPAQGGTVVSMEFEATGEAGTEQSIIHLPLPGVGAAPGLPPHGLWVTRALPGDAPPKAPDLRPSSP
jgi:hypothetical protein